MARVTVDQWNDRVAEFLNLSVENQDLYIEAVRHGADPYEVIAILSQDSHLAEVAALLGMEPIELVSGWHAASGDLFEAFGEAASIVLGGGC